MVSPSLVVLHLCLLASVDSSIHLFCRLPQRSVELGYGVAQVDLSERILKPDFWELHSDCPKGHRTLWKSRRSDMDFEQNSTNVLWIRSR